MVSVHMQHSASGCCHTLRCNPTNTGFIQHCWGSVGDSLGAAGRQQDTLLHVGTDMCRWQQHFLKVDYDYVKRIM